MGESVALKKDGVQRHLQLDSEGVPAGAIRLVVARCEVLYTGRLTAVLPEAVRLLVFKADGSVLAHDDSGAYKPLN
jgi:RecB family endonuclease NucS